MTTWRTITRSIARAVRLRPAIPATPDYLRRQVERSWEKESQLLQRIGLADGMSVLDLGCGPGYFAESLANWLPNARITALDSSPAMLDLARQRLRAEVIEASADATGLPANTFDFVIARLLFQHLSDPAAVAREALRVLKPGGRLVIIDIDDELFGVVEPPVPGLRRLMKVYGRAQSERGGNRNIGRALPRILLASGFAEPQIECIAIHSDQAGLPETFPQLDPAPLRSLVNNGRLSEAELTQLSAARERFVASDNPYAMILLFAAWGLKSPQAQ